MIPKNKILPTVFVTGGTGMLGSHLLLSLLQNGYSVHALKRRNSDLSLIQRVFHYYSDEADALLQKIIWCDGDVLQPKTIEDAMQGCSLVCHTAALVSFHPEDHQTMMKINIEGTKNVMKTALKMSVQKVVHVSSIASFGRANSSGFVDESCHWTDDTNSSCYSISKYESEKIVWDYYQHGLKAVIVNPSVIIGAGDWCKGSAQLMTTMYRGLKFYTQGINGYVDVRDVAQVMIALLENSVVGERFILNGGNLTYQTLFTYMADGLKVPPPKYCVAPWMADVAWRVAKCWSVFTGKKPIITRETARTAMKKYEYSNEKICDTIGYQFIPLEKSIKETTTIFLQDVAKGELSF